MSQYIDPTPEGQRYSSSTWVLCGISLKADHTVLQLVTNRQMDKADSITSSADAACNNAL